VDKVALYQVLLRNLRFPAVSIIPPLCRTCLHPNTSLVRTSGRNFGAFKHGSAVGDIGELRRGEFCQVALGFRGLNNVCFKMCRSVHADKLFFSVTTGELAYSFLRS